MTIKVAGPRVLVKPDAVEKTTESGIVLTSSTYEEKLEKAGQERGTVVAIGSIAFKAFEIGPNGEHIGEPWCKVGDHIQYSKYANTVTKDIDTGEEYVIINDEDVKAVLREAE